MLNTRQKRILESNPLKALREVVGQVDNIEVEMYARLHAIKQGKYNEVALIYQNEAGADAKISTSTAR